MQEFDKDSLAGHDGKKDAQSVYIAHQGKVYDVSGSKLWKNGEHMKRHQAGHDLTEEFADAPHGTEVFERVQQVGTLPTAAKQKQPHDLPPWLDDLFKRFPLLRRHPHPMLVHYPIVFMFAAPLFTLLAFASGNHAFETTAFHCLAAGLLFLPLTIATGLLTWWVNYAARFIRPVTIKLWCSVALLLLAALLFVWRLLDPGIATVPGAGRALYLVLLFCLIPVVSVIGWFGAHLTFPTGKKGESP